MSGTALCSLLTLTSSTLKLENGDEQAAAIRRELDGRMQLAESIMSSRDLTQLLKSSFCG